jgi:acetyltransferase-like isoleucine patch superfamily enzyme
MPYLRRVVANSIASSHLLPLRARARLLAWCGAKLGKNVTILPGVLFRAPALVSLGDGVYINYRCIFTGQERITLAARCSVGPGVTFASSSHQLDLTGSRRAGPLESGPITVGEGVWIGANSTILSGVTIGAGCVIGAGALVLKDCDADTVYTGAPARPVRALAGLKAAAPLSAMAAAQVLPD